MREKTKTTSKNIFLQLRNSLFLNQTFTKTKNSPELKRHQQLIGCVSRESTNLKSKEIVENIRNLAELIKIPCSFKFHFNAKWSQIELNCFGAAENIIFLSYTVCKRWTVSHVFDDPIIRHNNIHKWCHSWCLKNAFHSSSSIRTC